MQGQLVLGGLMVQKAVLAEVLGALLALVVETVEGAVAVGVAAGAVARNMHVHDLLQWLRHLILCNLEQADGVRAPRQEHVSPFVESRLQLQEVESRLHAGAWLRNRQERLVALHDVGPQDLQCKHSFF